jgi:hypothetical protein
MRGESLWKPPAESNAPFLHPVVFLAVRRGYAIPCARLQCRRNCSWLNRCKRVAAPACLKQSGNVAQVATASLTNSLHDIGRNFGLRRRQTCACGDFVDRLPYSSDSLCHQSACFHLIQPRQDVATPGYRNDGRGRNFSCALGRRVLHAKDQGRGADGEEQTGKRRGAFRARQSTRPLTRGRRTGARASITSKSSRHLHAETPVSVRRSTDTTPDETGKAGSNRHPVGTRRNRRRCTAPGASGHSPRRYPLSVPRRLDGAPRAWLGEGLKP